MNKYCEITSYTIYLIPDGGRTLAANMRGVGMAPKEEPEWKKHISGGAKASYGKKETKSIIEQRQSLPIFKLKDDLLKVCLKKVRHKICLSDLIGPCSGPAFLLRRTSK